MISPNGPRNRLLAAFPESDLDLLLPHLELVRLDVHQVLEEPGHLISHVYFIESGLVSMVGTTKPNHRIEVGMIGYEGMTGHGVLLGNNRSANELLVRSAGAALRISAPLLREIMGSSESLNFHLAKLCPHFHGAEQPDGACEWARQARRAARSLAVEWHDRVESNEFPTTNELLALLLGVRRASVTIALHELEG